MRAEKVTQPQEGAQVRDGLRHGDLQDRIDLGRQRPHTIATDNETQKLRLATHKLALRALGQELMLTEGSQNSFDMLKMSIGASFF